MGDVDQQSAVSPAGADGRYTAMVHRDWEIWGPCGGYVAAIALRAAGAESPFARPASFFCHYLSVASFEPVDLEVTPLRSGRTVLAQRVQMTQHDRPVLEAMVWSVGEVAGLEHQDVTPPQVDDPDSIPERTMGPPPEDADEERRGPPFPFWDNFEQRPLEWTETWPPPGPLPPTWRTWVRYRDTSNVDDPWVDAARLLLVLDVGSWPAGHRPHAHREHGFIAPSLDLYGSFQDPRDTSGWLLIDAHSPVARDGLLSWTSRVWSERRTLLANGGGQAVFRHT
jgi:acyl-CoA thioesterase II